MGKNLGHIRFWFFPFLSIILALLITKQNFHIFSRDDAVVYCYIANARKGHFGYGVPVSAGNYISFAGLKTGDIILGGYDNCSYGRFSHAGVYIGNNKVVEAAADKGITVVSACRYWDYPKICLLRVNADPEKKQAAVNYMLSLKGGIFFPLAFKPGERIWNCSKLIWKAYAEQGINLDPGNDVWIAPEVFARSEWVSIVEEKDAGDESRKGSF